MTLDVEFQETYELTRKSLNETQYKNFEKQFPEIRLQKDR